MADKTKFQEHVQVQADLPVPPRKLLLPCGDDCDDEDFEDSMESPRKPRKPRTLPLKAKEAALCISRALRVHRRIGMTDETETVTEDLDSAAGDPKYGVPRVINASVDALQGLFGWKKIPKKFKTRLDDLGVSMIYVFSENPAFEEERVLFYLTNRCFDTKVISV